MSLLGYDLGLLDALRRQMRAAAESLGTLRSVDPSAASSTAVVDAVRRALEHQWLPDVARVLDRDPLAGPLAPWTRPTSNGDGAWREQLGGARGDADRGADRGADGIAGPTIDADTDAWIEGWADTFDGLAERRMAIEQELVWDHENLGLHVARVAIDLLVATRVAAMVAQGANREIAVHRVLPRTTPMAAALVLTHLDLPDATVARLGLHLIQAWHAGGERGERFDDWFSGGDNTADIVLRLLADRPDAATAFLERVTPAELFLSAQHDELVSRVLLVGTSPSQVDERAAGELLRPLIEWSMTHQLPGVNDGLTRTSTAVLAGAVVPWLPALGPRAAAWGWTYDDGDAALRWMLDDRAALAAMTAAADQWQQRAGDSRLLDDDGRIDDQSLRDLAATMAQVQIALRDQEIEAAMARAFEASLVMNAASAVIGGVATGGSASAAMADLGASVLTPLTMRALDRWSDVRSPTRAAREAQDTLGGMAVDTAVLAVAGLVGQAIERGDLPPDALDRLDLTGLTDRSGATGCHPREASDRLHTFVAELEPITDAATHHALLTVVYAFANPLSDAQLCN